MQHVRPRETIPDGKLREISRASIDSESRQGGSVESETSPLDPGRRWSTHRGWTIYLGWINGSLAAAVAVV